MKKKLKKRGVATRSFFWKGDIPWKNVVFCLSSHVLIPEAETLRTSIALLWISNMLLRNSVALFQNILHCFECSNQCRMFWSSVTLFWSSVLLIQSSTMLVQQKTSIMLLWAHCFTLLSLTRHAFIKTCSLFLIKAWCVRERSVKQWIQSSIMLVFCWTSIVLLWISNALLRNSVTLLKNILHA